MSNSQVADPAPLGLAAFALTTFLLSAKNADWTRGTDAWLGYAFAYGGLAQLLAGMWEFRRNNTFGATAFSTFGAFWIGLGLYAKFLPANATVAQINNDRGWILLAFAIFTAYMAIAATQVNEAVLAVFVTLVATLVVLTIGNFAGNTNLVKVGGWLGVITAAVAWYTSAAGVINGVLGRAVLKVGHPLASRETRIGAHPVPH